MHTVFIVLQQECSSLFSVSSGITRGWNLSMKENTTFTYSTKQSLLPKIFLLKVTQTHRLLFLWTPHTWNVNNRLTCYTNINDFFSYYYCYYSTLLDLSLVHWFNTVLFYVYFTCLSHLHSQWQQNKLYAHTSCMLYIGLKRNIHICIHTYLRSHREKLEKWWRKQYMSTEKN